MSERSESRLGTVYRVSLIVALFVIIILGLVLFFQFQLDAAVAIRVYVGGEGLWAKAQKDAVLSLERYTVSRDEADYQTYLRLIQVPLGDQKARLELQKPQPDLTIVREGYCQGRNHPVDIEYAIPFFRRFEHTSYLSRVIEHWSRADQLIAELMRAAEALHEEVAGRARPEAIRAIGARLADINRHVTEEEDQFSATLAEASRWATDASRTLTYAVAFLFAVLGIILSWSIIRRIRLTENALVESENRYRTIFERVSDVIYTIGPDSKFLSLSPACERMTGWLPAELVGQPFAAIVHPDDLPQAVEIFRKTLGGQSTASVEVRLKTKSGQHFDAEHSVVPISSGGRVTAVLGIARDISERKRMEMELRESEQRLRAVLEATVDGILVADTEAEKFVIANRAICDMLGYEPEELYGLGVQDIHPPEVLPEVRRQFERMLKGKIRVAPNLPVKCKDGQIVLADVSGAPMTLSGRPHMVGVFHDVTERKQAEEAIRALNEGLEGKIQERTRALQQAQDELVRKEKLSLLGQVAGSVGHELRNPLGVMNNAVYFLQTVLADADATTKEYLAMIKDEIAAADRIVSDLLDSVRTKPPQLEQVNVLELIDQVLRKFALPGSVTVKLDIPATLPGVLVDPRQMQQVFRNLIANGSEAMPAGGILEIRARENREAGTVTVDVRDGGIGMTPEHLAKLFQPLFTTKARGIGLGLVVVRNLTEANGGTVAVQSEAGVGSVFSITLPAADEKEHGHT